MERECGWLRLEEELLFAIRCIYAPEGVCQLALLTARVPEGLKKQMRKLMSVNWSELLRQAIGDRIELEQRNLVKDWNRVREGSRKADAIRHEMERKYGHIDFNNAETIKYWREKRFSAPSPTPQ